MSGSNQVAILEPQAGGVDGEIIEVQPVMLGGGALSRIVQVWFGDGFPLERQRIRYSAPRADVGDLIRKPAEVPA